MDAPGSWGVCWERDDGAVAVVIDGVGVVMVIVVKVVVVTVLMGGLG